MTRWLSLALIAAALGCSSAPPSSLAPARLLDAGFEVGALSENPVTGWYSDAGVDGRLVVNGDTSSHVEGEKSLCVDLLRDSPAGAGRPSITQVVNVNSGSPTDLEFSASLRGKTRMSAMLVAYVWDDGVAREISRHDVPIESTWSRAAVQFSVPKDRQELGLFVFLPSDARSRVWIDDARLQPYGE